MRDSEAWVKLYSAEEAALDAGNPGSESCSTLPSGDLVAYSMRGWCRLEVLSALCPKRTLKGLWRRGPFNVRHRFHTDANDPGMGPLITAADLRDPHWGRFSNEGDRELVTDLVIMIAQRYTEYLASGSSAWSATLDMDALPTWLVTAGTAGAHAVFEDSGIGPPPSATAAVAQSTIGSSKRQDNTARVTPQTNQIAPTSLAVEEVVNEA